MPDMRTGAEPVGYRKVLVAATIGTLIEVYDILIYGYFATVLSQQFFAPGDPTAALLATFAIFAVGFFLRPLGAVIFGHVGDRFGRRTALAFSLLLMTLATVAFGLLPTYAAVGLLAPSCCCCAACCRDCRSVPNFPEPRCSYSINAVGGGLATVAAATVSLVLARLLSPDQLAAWGWRVAFLIAAPIGLVGLYVRTRLLDSPAFVALGQTARKDRAPLLRPVRTAKRGMLVLTVWFGAQTIAGYTLSVLMPSYLIREAGLGPAQAYAANLVAVLISATFTLLGGVFVDRLPASRSSRRANAPVGHGRCSGRGSPRTSPSWA